MHEGIKGYTKVRVTFNTIVNVPGNYMSLQVVGKSKQPRCFIPNFDPYLSFRIKYYNTVKGWMNQEVFEEIVRWFYAKETKNEPGRQMIMLMDNFSGHKLGPPHMRLCCKGSTATNINHFYFCSSRRTRQPPFNHSIRESLTPSKPIIATTISIGSLISSKKQENPSTR